MQISGAIKQTHLFHVCTADKLGAEKEIFTSGECEVSSYHVERVLQVALVRVEHVRLVVVVLAHHFHREAIDCSLKVALFGIYHHSNVAFFRMLPQRDIDALSGVYSDTTQLNSTDPVEQRTAKSVVFLFMTSRPTN